MEPIRVSSPDFQRDVARHQDVALQRLVAGSTDGRDQTVLLSSADYGRLKRRDREVLTLDDLTADDLAALEASAFDHGLDG